MKSKLLRTLPIALGVLFLTSCNGSSSGGPNIGNLPGPTTPQFTRMYDSQDGNSLISIIPPPITSPLTPAGAFASDTFDADNGLAFNSTNGTLAQMASAAVYIYNPPYSSSTIPTVKMTGGATTLSGAEQGAFDASGNLWVSDETVKKVDEFTPPFSPTGAPTATNTDAVTPDGLAINTVAGLMFIGDTSSGNVLVVPAPYTGVATATMADPGGDPTAIAVDQLGRIFVGDASSNTIYVFTPPFATGNHPAFALSVGAGATNRVFNLALDPSQNLYAQITNGTVVVFNGPILGTIAAPSANLGCPPTGCHTWAGLAFGP